MRTRELITFIEKSISELEIEKEIIMIEWKKKRFTFKKQARKLYIDLNFIMGQIDSLEKLLKIAKIPSKS